jgi:hypothetical protein
MASLPKRLLHVDTLKLVEPQHDEDLKYVVVSHTWADDEFAYTDFVENRYDDSFLREARAGPGKNARLKIPRLCQFVRLHIPSIKHIWIDTVCINRKDNQELQESIPAMYQWYLSASVCLAYLTDVEFCADVLSNSGYPLWEQQFRGSVWHTRGWTLQELLAPKLVLFLDASQQVIGYKGIADSARDLNLSLELRDCLHGRLADATGIPVHYFEDPVHVERANGELIGQWMSQRRTTLPEDMTYCLLGLHGLSMPINYGEGIERARERLHEAQKHHPRTRVRGGLPSLTHRADRVNREARHVSILNDPVVEIIPSKSPSPPLRSPSTDALSPLESPDKVKDFQDLEAQRSERASIASNIVTATSKGARRLGRDGRMCILEVIIVTLIVLCIAMGVRFGFRSTNPNPDHS